MNLDDRPALAEILNRLPFVRWDRLGDVLSVGGEFRAVNVFGWIDRDDGRFDFVRVTFSSWTDDVGYSTSSARYSAEVGRLLGYPPEEHFDCIRVEDYFGDLVERKVELS